LNALGLEAYGVLKKTRTIYHLDNAHFEIDKYLGNDSYIPVFLEIEAESEEQVYKYAKILGFKANDCKPWTFSELKNYYDEKQK
jgi:adenylate cyclase class IV